MTSEAVYLPAEQDCVEYLKQFGIDYSPNGNEFGPRIRIQNGDTRRSDPEALLDVLAQKSGKASRPKPDDQLDTLLSLARLFVTNSEDPEPSTAVRDLQETTELVIRRTRSDPAAAENDVTQLSSHHFQNGAIKGSISVESLDKVEPSGKPVTKAFKAFFQGKNNKSKHRKGKQSEDESLGTSSYQSERELEEIWSKATANFNCGQTWRPFEKDAQKATCTVPVTSKTRNNLRQRSRKSRQQKSRVNDTVSGDDGEVGSDLPELIQVVEEVESRLHTTAYKDGVKNDSNFLPVVRSWQMSGEELNMEHLRFRTTLDGDCPVVRPSFVDRATQTGTEHDRLPSHRDKHGPDFHASTHADTHTAMEYVTSKQAASPPPDIVPGNLQRAHRHPRENPLLVSARKGHVESLTSLLAGASLDDVMMVRDLQGNTAVHMAAERGRLECVQVLLQRFPQFVKEENRAKLTPAVVAIKNGQIEIVDWMLENVFSPDDLIEPGIKRPLLHQAAKYGQDGCLRLFLDKITSTGCDVLHHRDFHGNTPAHLAAKHGHLTCLQTLVEYGVDVTTANKYGHTPCYYADFSNHRHCAGYLIIVEACVSMGRELLTNVCNNDPDTREHVSSPAGAESETGRIWQENNLVRSVWDIIRACLADATQRLLVYRTGACQSYRRSHSFCTPSTTFDQSQIATQTSDTRSVASSTRTKSRDRKHASHRRRRRCKSEQLYFEKHDGTLLNMQHVINDIVGGLCAFPQRSESSETLKPSPEQEEDGTLSAEKDGYPVYCPVHGSTEDFRVIAAPLSPEERTGSQEANREDPAAWSTACTDTQRASSSKEDVTETSGTSTETVTSASGYTVLDESVLDEEIHRYERVLKHILESNGSNTGDGVLELVRSPSQETLQVVEEILGTRNPSPLGDRRELFNGDTWAMNASSNNSQQTFVPVAEEQGIDEPEKNFQVLERNNSVNQALPVLPTIGTVEADACSPTKIKLSDAGFKETYSRPIVSLGQSNRTSFRETDIFHQDPNFTTAECSMSVLPGHIGLSTKPYLETDLDQVSDRDSVDKSLERLSLEYRLDREETEGLLQQIMNERDMLANEQLGVSWYELSGEESEVASFHSSTGDETQHLQFEHQQQQQQRIPKDEEFSGHLNGEQCTDL